MEMKSASTARVMRGLSTWDFPRGEAYQEGRSGSLDIRCGQALDHDVEAGGEITRDRALSRGPQLIRRGHAFSVATEGDAYLVVARRQQLAADGALRAVIAELDLVFGVPARIVAD